MKTYIVMVRSDGKRAPFSGIYHSTRFAAFLEMEHARNDAVYAGYVFYIQEVER